MGHRLHSAKKYEVKYGEREDFNYSSEYINRIIDCLAEGDSCCNDEDCFEYADTLEANRGNLLRNMERIIKPDENWEWQKSLDEILDEMEGETDKNLTREYVYTNLKEIVEESDPNCDMVHFAWF